MLSKLRESIKEILNEIELTRIQDEKLYSDYEELLKTFTKSELEKEYERLDGVSKLRFKTPKSAIKSHANRAKKLVKKYMKINK